MPNPLLNSKEMNQSREPSDSMSDHEPVMEEYAGENFPYRGIETHGVKPTADPTNMPDWREDGRLVPVAYVPEGVEIAPIPVRIVTSGQKEVKKFRVNKYVVPDTPVQMLPRDATRTRIRIRNRSTSLNIFIGSDSSVTEDFGYIVGTSATLELVTTEEVWAIAGAGNTVSIDLLTEYVVVVP